MARDSLGIKQVLRDLNSMEKEIGRIQDVMKRGLAARTALVEKISGMGEPGGNVTVFGKKERARSRRRRN